jgi:hypothetical protein
MPGNSKQASPRFECNIVEIRRDEAVTWAIAHAITANLLDEPGNDQNFGRGVDSDEEPEERDGILIAVNAEKIAWKIPLQFTI